ncbi:symmetrical bis(5'-nucleosyl)-tetraphosphatase [Ideonella dechloratans]|uniref:symmetrical bis(5'-nucleosyl)-tetraphosphatase n=1 Tax=Ideonella dechloratans TaxID=36863 RepID=UPI0035B2211B
MHYLIGDLQGCCDAFERLLAELDFSPSRDHLHLLGDLVNRGPDSLGVLRRLRDLEGSATCLLGNHDLHLLAVAAGVKRPNRKDTLDAILADEDREGWLAWLRQRKLADLDQGWLMVHAGVLPQWDTAKTLALAAEVEDLLRGPELPAFLQQMYGNHPARWQDDLQGLDRLRAIVNVLTRIRFCAADGTLDLETKDSAEAAPPGMRPWFEHPHRATASQPIAFGHWSTLGLINRPTLLAIDTGCIWGGALTAVRVDGGRRDVVQVRCAQAQAPGKG